MNDLDDCSATEVLVAVEGDPFRGQESRIGGAGGGAFRAEMKACKVFLWDDGHWM